MICCFSAQLNSICLPSAETTSILHREINCNGSVKEKLGCVLSASWSHRGSGVLHRHTSVSTWRSNAFGSGVKGYELVLLDVSLLFTWCWWLGFSPFQHIFNTFEDVLGLFTVHGVLFRVRKTCLPCGCDKFLCCSLRQQSTKVEKVIVFGCVCDWTTWRTGALVPLWTGVRHGAKTSFSSFLASPRRVCLVCLRPLWI